MKKIAILCALIAVISSTQTLSAQEYRTGLGVRLSSANAMQNNSISIKQFINERTAIEGLFTFGDPLALGG